MSNKKNSKMYGGLIKKSPEVTKDRHGNVTTKHFDGHQDVTINAEKVTVLSVPKMPGGKD